MNERPPPKFTAFNKRDISATLSIAGPFIFVVALSACMHTFVLNAIEANLYINAGIIGASVFGVFLILRRLFAAQEDFRILERFGYEAKQGIYMKSLLEQPWLQNRYIRHYLSHIADTGGTLASQLEQTAIESELHALQADYDSRLELPQFLVGFMIAMGLLGTFIGLLETLTGISGMLNGMGGGPDVQKQFLKLVVELRKPLAGMGIAFSASMFGLVTSLMLSVMMTNLRRYISRVISLARNVMHDLTEVVHGKSSSESLSPLDISRLLSDSDGGSSETAEQSSATGSGGGFGVLNPAMSGRFDILTKKIENLLVAIEGTNQNNAKLVELVSYGPRMKEISEKTLDEIKTIAAFCSEQHSSTRSLATALIGYGPHMKEICEKTLEEIKAIATYGREQQASTQTLATALIDSGPHMKEIFEKTLDEIKTIATHGSEQHASTQSLVSTNLDLLRVISLFADSQKIANSDEVEQMRKLSALAVDMRDADIGNGRHLHSLKEDFTQLNKNAEMVEMIATSISGQTALLEVLIQESRRSQQALAVINQSILTANSKEK